MSEHKDSTYYAKVMIVLPLVYLVLHFITILVANEFNLFEQLLSINFGAVLPSVFEVILSLVGLLLFLVFMIIRLVLIFLGPGLFFSGVLFFIIKYFRKK